MHWIKVYKFLELIQLFMRFKVIVEFYQSDLNLAVPSLQKFGIPRFS